MSTKRITINAFSSSDVRRARAELIKYKSEVQQKFNKLMQALSDKGIELAKQNLTAYHMPYATGELESSIQGVYDPETGKGAIFSDCNHAVYFEFGTGIKGATSPHPDAGEQGYVYDTSGHGYGGWYYYTDDLYWTQGMPSRPFMWTTANQLRQMLDDMAKQIFNS